MAHTNKILIITTQGCEGCSIAKENVNSAKKQSNKKIDVQVEDWHTIDRRFIAEKKIKDFPTVLYILDNAIVYKCSGTYPTPVYLRWIDMYFK